MEVQSQTNTSVLEIASLVSLLKYKHHLSQKEVSKLLKSDEIFIPLSIMTDDLSVLETVVKYLRENLLLKNNDIAELLGRDFRTISTTYSHSKQKYSQSFLHIDFQYSFPISVLSSRKHSVLESVVLYLKIEHKLSFKIISKLLHRNYQTVWTVARRAKLK